MTSFAVISHFFVVHTDHIITHSTKHPSSFSFNKGGSKCKPPTVAVLISGQFSRFVFKENKGPLVTSSSWWGCGGPTVDVYIALHHGELAKPWIGQISAPPYINGNATIAEIKQYYLEQRNATSVQIKFTGDDDMNHLDMQLLHLLSTRRIPDAQKRKIQQHYDRFKSNTRMLYMRHLAYTMSINQHKSYDVFISQREDAFFYQPLNLTEMDYNDSTLDNVSSEEPNVSPELKRPYVLVEKWCKFRDSYSDKIHIGNDASMSTLWGNNQREFMSLIVRFMDFGYARNELQTEAFLQDLLYDSDLYEVDMKRADLRYVDTKRCVPWLYYKCLPDHAKLGLSELGIRDCCC
jgi:hypothetical protein